MTEDDELTIVVRAAQGAGALERDGMLRRLEEAVSVAVSEVALDGYVTSGSTEPDEVRLVIAATHLASPEMLSLVGDSVADLLADPELAGWGPYSVNVTDEVGEEDGEELLDWIPPVEDDDSLDDADEDEDALAEFDLQAARTRLEQDATRVASALDLARLTAGDDQSAGLEAKYAAGALFQASVTVLDNLFMDLQTLATELYGSTAAEVDDEALFALHELPERYADHYDALFTQELIVATTDVTRRFTAGWEPVACVAQELALRMILNATGFHLEQAEVELPGNWRSVIEDYLFEDLEHEALYDDEADLEGESASVYLAFEHWFTPFSPEAALPPYLLDEDVQV